MLSLGNSLHNTAVSQSQLRNPQNDIKTMVVLDGGGRVLSVVFKIYFLEKY